MNTRLHATATHLKSPKPYRDSLLSEYLGTLALTSPGLTEEQYLSRLQAASEQIDQKLGSEADAKDSVDLMSRIAEVGARVPGMEGVAATVKNALRDLVISPISRYDTWSDALAAQRYTDQETSILLDEVSLAGAGRIRKVALDLGVDHPAVRVWNSQVGVRSGITAGATTADFLADAELNEVVGLSEILKYSPGDPRWQQEVDKRLGVLLAANNKIIKDAVEAIDELQSTYDGAFLWSTSAPAEPPCAPGAAIRTDALADCKSAFERAQESAGQRGKYIKHVEQGLKGLVSVVDFADKESGRRVKYLGEAAIKVASAINDYLPKIAGKGLQDALFSLGSVVLTGNILGAIGALLPLFQAGQPSIEMQILTELGKLRQEVVTLQTVMYKQFDAVNKNLNVIYTEMLGKFDEVLKLQQVSIAQLTQIQGQLHTIEQKVDTWSSEIIRSLQNGALQEARTALNRHLRRSSGKPVASFAEYDEAEKWVHFAGVSQAREVPFVPGKGSYPTHENDPVAVLDLYEETGGATGFLTWYGNRRYGWPASVSAGDAEKIPNAAVWLSMATGYRQLAAENPAYAAQMNPQRTADLVAAGLDIDAAVGALSRPASTPNPDGSHTNKLYTGLVEDYKNAATDFNAALLPLQKQAVDNKDYKLFGTADQAIATQPAPPNTVPFCTGSSGQGPILNLQRPANVTYSGNAIPMARYAFPEGSRPTLGYCHQVAFTDDPITSTLSVTMHLRITWPSASGQPPNPPQTLRTWTKTWEVPGVCRRPDSSPEPPSACNPSQYYLDRWVSGGYQQSFAETATLTEYPEPQQAVRTQVARFLTGRQKGYYDAVVTELTTPGKPLFQANADLTTALRLLQAYTAAGFPTALNDDELLQVLLHGAERLPADTPGDTTITTIFRTAQSAYNSCAATSDTACAATLNPFAGQQHAWLTNCLTWYKNQLPVARWSQDPLANTITAFAYHTADALRLRYDHHSKNLKQNSYTETLAPVTTAHKLLETYDTMTRPSTR
ncbi:hypothetical protein ABZU75_09515 [Streptosporangium sp. NPDC005286]|uniref:hypothetical protein n=1 Tax=Streptosporangium sp. NPDC005286 TaxID=3154463 RepID=UPI0033B0CB56